MSDDATLDQLARALDDDRRLIAGVTDDEWAKPTPCTEWTVRDLVNHLVGGTQLFARLLSGEPMPGLDELQRWRGADHLGDDPVGAYDRSAAELLAAFRSPGALQEMFNSPIGTVPGGVLLHLRITELLTHGWDLARATGQPGPFANDLAEQELAFTEASLGRVPPDRPPFAPPQPVPADADAIDRLAAALGRRVAGA
jgi:uncharacterized protein (TIGR03086 family)